MDYGLLMWNSFFRSFKLLDDNPFKKESPKNDHHDDLPIL